MFAVRYFHHCQGHIKSQQSALSQKEKEELFIHTQIEFSVHYFFRLTEFIHKLITGIVLQPGNNHTFYKSQLKKKRHQKMRCQLPSPKDVLILFLRGDGTKDKVCL